MKISKPILTLGLTLTSSLGVLAAGPNDLTSLIKSLGGSSHSLPYPSDKNQEVFSRYCVGAANSPDIPQPNYSEPLVREAALKLSKTKMAADGRLLEMGKKESLNKYNEVLKILQGLTSTAAPGIPEVVAGIVSQLNTSSSGLDSNLKLQIQKLSTAYVNLYKKNLLYIGNDLNKAVKPMDKALLTKAGKKLEDNLLNELKSFNLPALHHALSNFIRVVEPALPPYDSKSLDSAIKSLQNRVDEVIKIDPDLYLKEVAASLASFAIPQGKLGKGFETSYSLNQLQGIDYLLTEMKPEVLQKISEPVQKFRQQEAVLKAHISLILAMGIDANIKNEMDKPPKNQSVSAINGQSNQLIQLTQENLVHQLFPQNKYFPNFIKENQNFSNDQIKNQIKEINLLFTKGDFSSISWKFPYFADNLEPLMPSLTEDTKEQLRLIQLQINGTLAQQAITSISRALEMIGGANNTPTSKTLDNEIYSVLNYAVTSVPAGIILPEPGNQSLQFLRSVNEELYEVYSLGQLIADTETLSESKHFYFYGSIKRLYQLSDKEVPSSAGAPAGTLPVGHNFLVQLCGEFRDRATMIEAKLNWIKNLYTLPSEPQKGIDPSRNIWSQVSSASYQPYLILASSLWEARRASQPRTIQIPGLSQMVDNPVGPTTVCETKFIFTEYLSRNPALGFDSLNDFMNGNSKHRGYKSYQDVAGNCTAEDKVDSYNFRGDSNFKHYSPESNGMIWPATSIGNNCVSPTQAKSGQTTYTDADCKNYFSRPFNTRYESARAGLATWLYRASKYDKSFSSQGSMVAIYPHTSPSLAPFSFSFDNESTTNDLFDFDQNFLKNNLWTDSGIGFNEYTGLGSQKPNYALAFARIQDAVDRHTDWYSSGYNDKAGTSKEQAYSPFVASSYVMSESDSFTSCGITVQCPPDGLKRWMFIFRVKPQNWYNPSKLVNNEKINFDTMWFDETSFGKSSLADSEKAWDRLGTSLEGEMDSILYLINVQENFDGQSEEGD